MKVAPRPGALSTRIAPPISSASARLIASPSPAPAARRVDDPSTWKNRSKMRSCCAGSMPAPVSATTSSSPPDAPDAELDG